MLKAMPIHVSETDDRFSRLRESISEYLEIGQSIQTGIEASKEIESNRNEIMRRLNASASDWNDYRWQ
jgi:sRNA-binding carbon storage regulator CsrA